MPDQFRITRIKKPGGSDNTTTHIEEVFVENTTPVRSLFPPFGLVDKKQYGLGLYQSQGVWRTVASVVADIDSKQAEYYVERASKRVNVITVPFKLIRNIGSSTIWLDSHRKFIKTEPDETKADNLLSLPNDYGK
jgi:hypothetical protein